MKLGIAAKVFLALLVVSVVAVLAMSVASRISFTRGFLGYLNEQGNARVESLLPEFAAAYEEHGSWRFLRSRRGGWFDILRPGGGRRSSRQGWERASSADTALASIDLRLGLMDARGELVAGNAGVTSAPTRQAIRVDGQVVGWLAAVPFEQVSGAADLRFQQRQLHMTWLIAGASVLLAMAVALWFARTLLRGVRQAANSVHRLAAGDYTVQVPVLSGDEIGQLAVDCNQLAQTLQRTEQMRRAFMADVSHELRTPLAVLHGELEAIEDGVREPSPESIRSLHGEVESLSKLVGDLYNLSLADAGALAYRMEDVDASGILQLALEAHRERLTERRIDVETRGLSRPLPVRGDRDRLRQLFGNLIENAARYTNPGGMLRIEGRVEGEWVVIDFEDSEPGVAAELLPRLFERFFRAEESRNRAGGGAGLGLAICKAIVDAHGGSITARPSSLGGLRITIALA